jgi:alkanesulfonate monooxygenase SsuD/methylene tetrahydromethanopterin reductase-like flavin-dependent oxidoreductase (luciferase family)
VDSPLTLLREHLTTLRALLRSERVTVDGRYVKLDDVALGWPPATAPAVFAGATGPRSLRLSGEAADGTILVAGTPLDGIREARRLIDEGRAASGRTDHHRVTAYLHAATGPNGAARLATELDHWGDTSKPDVAVAGNADAVANAVRRLADAGADAVILQPTADEPDPEGFMRFVATEVRPLVP